MSTEGKRWMLLDQPAQMLEVAPDDDEAFYGPFYVLASEYDRLRSILAGLVEVVDAAILAGDWEVDGTTDPDVVLHWARAALAGGDRFPCHMEREHYFRCKRPCGHPRCEIEKP